MRSYKVKLLMKFVNKISTEVYLDAQKVQALYTCQQLRCFSRYFTFDTQKLGLPQENVQIFNCETSNLLENYPLNYLPESYV